MIRLDPRTKIVLLLLTVVFSAVVPTGWYLCVWIALTALTGILSGRVAKTLRAVIVYAVLWLCADYVLPLLGGTAHTSLLVWFALVFKCYPSCMMAGIVVGTTQISEFMAAMAKMRIPRTVVIPLAVMFRYFPVVREDWDFIRDAMALRGISFSPVCFVRNPEMVINALYVPVLVAASKAADELSMAAVTRGIENPGQRTSRLNIRFTAADLCAVLVFLAALTGGIWIGSR